MAPALTGLGRVFVNSGGIGHKYSYHASMKVDGLDKSLGDVTPIYEPNPDQYDDFREVATIKGADGRATSTLTAYLPINTESLLEELERNKCAFDLQVHYGSCTKPNSFNEFESAIIMRDVRLTSYGLSTLTARTPDERAVIDETASISVGSSYRVLPIILTKLPVIFLPANAHTFGIVNVGSKSCGDDCGERSTGCDTWIVGVINASDTISFVYTRDGGVTWTPTSANLTVLHNNPSSQTANMTAHGGYIYFTVSQGTSTYFYRASISSILNNNADSTSIMTNTNLAYYFEMTASENYVWYAGQRGSNVSSIRAYNPSTNTFQDFTGDTETFRSIHAYSDDVVVAGGVTGVIYYSNSFGAFTEVTTEPTPTNTVTGIHVFTPRRWLVATSGGVYLTNNAGASWNKVAESTSWAKVSFYDDIVGYMASGLGTYRTLDSGNTWQLISSATINELNDIIVCEHNPNRFFFTGGAPGVSYIYRGTP